MSTLADSSQKLAELAVQHEAVLVLYSGGKDSMATLNLCVQHFRRVVGVHMYFVPGMKVVEEKLDFARHRWGVDFLMLPHWLLSKFLRHGVYCLPQRELPEVKLPAVLADARKRTGISLIAHGGRSADSLWRRRQMRATASKDLVYPVDGWNKADTLGYLKSIGIDAPPSFSWDLTTISVLKLHDQYPEDYQRVLEMFPFAAAIVKRRELYGEVA